MSISCVRIPTEILPGELQPAHAASAATTPSEVYVLAVGAEGSLGLRGELQLGLLRGSLVLDGYHLRPRARRSSLPSKHRSLAHTAQSLAELQWITVVRAAAGPGLAVASAQLEGLQLQQQGQDYLYTLPSPLTEFLSQFETYENIALLRAHPCFAPAFAQLGGLFGSAFPASMYHIRSLSKRAKMNAGLDLPGTVALTDDVTVFPEDWRSFCDRLIGTLRIDRSNRPCTVLCGPKDVGKSTLLRLCVNRILSEPELVAGVAVLDCDPGQAELNPPGCLGLHIVRQPLLSSTFAQQQDAELLIHLGDSSPRDNLDVYLEAIKSLYRRFTELPQNIPLLVNTTGWVKGLGQLLLSDIIRITQPHQVIELQHFQGSRNIEPSFAEGLLLDSLLKDNQQQPAPKFEVIHLRQPEVDNSASSSVQNAAADLRALSLTASLLGCRPRMVQEQMVLQIPLNEILLGCTDPGLAAEELPTALNGNLVAMCTAPQGTATVQLDHFRALTSADVLPCVGYAVVRAVDIQSGYIYLSAAAAMSRDLTSVNALVRGNIALPAQIYLSQDKTQGWTMPYVSGDFGDVQALGRTARSTRQNLERN